MEFIDLRQQYLAYRDEIDARMRAVLEHGRFIMGPEVAELESALSAYVGVQHTIAVANGTVSLEIALRALGIGPGDEVITVPFTWISSAEVIELVGATPVFVDIEPHTFNIDPLRVADALTTRTKAVIAVDLFGQMADYEGLRDAVDGRDITIIQDAAQSFGSTRNGRRAGSAARIGSTSFFPAKPLGCYGDGGALFTDDGELGTRMRAIRTHGGIRRHEHELLGMNGRLDTLQAAVLLAKLPHFENELKAKASIARRYSQQLAEVCTTPATDPANTHVFAQYTVRVANRDGVAATLRDAGIPTNVYYPQCLHLERVFSSLGYKRGDFPVSEQASREVLSLPMHPFLEQDDQDKVIEAFRSA